MSAQLVQMFVIGTIGFGACLFLGLRIKHSSKWMLLAIGGFGLVGVAIFLSIALSGGIRP
jgi:hypothetical protein